VGQGDAALVEFPDGRRWLVDGGRRDEVLRALRRRGVRTLDAVIASHADADHAEGLLAVVGQLRVRTLIVGPGEGHAALREVARSRGIPVVVHPVLPGVSDNDGSVVVRANSPWGSVLFAGDLEAAGEAVHGVPSTVLKVPHHGARTSSSPGFLDRVRPVLAVIPVGPNRYGHPSAEVEGRYRERGVQVLRT
jgi:competence protein ComEC